jgi:hypothetical protein
MVFAWMAFVMGARAQFWINEVFFNPPGPEDRPHEFVELRGPANRELTNIYFLAIEGDADGNPGTVLNVFDLDGVRMGGNGLLVLAQNSNSFIIHSNAAALINTNGPGFGDGGSSGAHHRGKDGRTDFESASITFMLVRAAKQPRPGDDIDENDDGMTDGDAFASWTVFDSVGVLDSGGAGDRVYGRINFRRLDAPDGGPPAATGTNVALTFTPAYVARLKNSTNWAATSWLAGDEMALTTRGWTLAAGVTRPASYARKLLNHAGAPNFGAPTLPGILMHESGGSTDLIEGGAADSYTLALNSRARGGGLTVQVTAPADVEVSIDGGRSFGASRAIKLAGTKPVSVQVRALQDGFAGAQTRPAAVTHTIIRTGDPAAYPASTIIPPVVARVTDTSRVLMSELKVNPPGPDDAPFEYVELRGTPGATLANVQFVVIDGNAVPNPGTVATAVDLAGVRIGTNGLLVLAAAGNPYATLPGTTVLPVPQFLRTNDGGLRNGAATFMLVSTTNDIPEGTDLDAGDNGRPEGLPEDAIIVDSLAWRDGDGAGIIYTAAELLVANRTPDAATRFQNNDTPNSAAAWFGGNLDGTNGASLLYDPKHVSTNFPLGTALSPGVLNNSAPQISPLPAFPASIGDPTTPLIAFTISDAESPVAALAVSVVSSNQAVVASSNLLLSGTGAARTLTVQPNGVGYATITVRVSDGQLTGERSFELAASADARGNGRFHSGASDGSTAFAINPEWMLMGDDENQIIRLYSRSNSGPAVKVFDLNPFLGLTDFYDDGRPKEVDIEGSTVMGNRIFWTGSHSHAGDAEVRTNRARIFATDIMLAGSNSTLTFLGHYDFLKHDLLAWDAAGAHGLGADHYGLVASSEPGIDPKSPDGSGFNIEGLTMSPDDTDTAFLCFRAPLVPPGARTRALIVPVTNFTTLAISGAAPGAARFGTPIELDLGGRGIRSIEGSGTNYLLVTGPPGPSSNAPPLDFKLFTWTGSPTDTPRQHAGDLSGLNPEGIVAPPPLPWTATSQVQILSDNGITVYYGDDIEAKHLAVREFKKSRTDWITLGAVVPPPPVLVGLKRARGGGVVIEWRSQPGTTYRVQTKGSLADSKWADLPGDVTATNVISSMPVPDTVAPGSFFRVVATE